MSTKRTAQRRKFGDINEAALTLCVSPQTIRNRLAAGTWEYSVFRPRGSTRILFDIAEIERAIEASRIEPRSRVAA